jgi:O-antigen/teichoic acid export membrane protein
MKKYFSFLANPLFSGSAVMIIGSTIANFLGYVYHLILGRLLGPANYGELAAILSLTGLISALFGFMGVVIVKFISSAQGHEINSYIAWFTKKAIILGALIFGLTLVVIPFLSQFLHISAKILLLVPVFLFFFVVGFAYKSFLQGIIKFKEMVIATNVEMGTRVLLAVFLVSLGFSVFGATLGILLSAVIGFIIAKLYVGKLNHEGTIRNFNPGRTVLTYALPTLLVGIASNSLYSTDVLLVKHFFAPGEAGIYAALSTLGKIIFFGAAPVSVVMFPMVSKNHSLGKSTKKIFLLSVLLTGAICAGVLFIYLVFPNLAIGLLYGEKFLSASSHLALFGLFMSIFTIDQLIVSFYLSQGKTRTVSYLILLAAIAQAIGIWFFHGTLGQVISVSMVSVSLLLLSLLIYAQYEFRHKSN